MALLRFLILVAFAAPCFAEDFVEWVGANSGVNWSSGVIQAEGAGVGPEGRPPNIAQLMACRAAVVDAQRNLLESIQGVRVEGETVVANMMVESDVIKTSVQGLLEGAQVVKRTPSDDGSCRVEMTAPLGGEFATTVYGEVFTPGKVASRESLSRMTARIGERALDWIIAPAMAEEPKLERPPWQDAFDKLSSRIDALEDLLAAHPAVVEASDKGPSGLVLDARGSNFIPSMSPRIRQLRGGIIYPNEAHQAKLRERGQLVSLFTRDLGTAQRHPKVGERPLVLKALRTFGETRTEIVLGTDSADSLQGLVDKGFLDEASVIIVL